MAESKHHAEINETQYRRYISFLRSFKDLFASELL